MVMIPYPVNEAGLIETTDDTRFVGKTKENTDWETWWGMVVEAYKYGFLDCPILGFNKDYPYKWYTPTAEDTERFVQDQRVQALYKGSYENGEDPHDALAGNA